ncbi:MAG: RNA methyltransferase, partial [Alphaproteobacteria bacterium]|nr:RNA methyltransferase [Alphaproteobacteria bacterium]
MAGTDKSKAGTSTASAGGPAPVVILVRPQLPENIGAAARAMLNCGLTEMRLVAPSCRWPNPKAVALASGADAVLDGATIFPTMQAAIADLGRVYATSARSRGLVKPVVNARAAAADLQALVADGQRCGLVFGPERTGLESDEVALADVLVQIPLNPAFGSLNLGQAVLLVAHEWFHAGLDPQAHPARSLPLGGSRPATKEEMQGLFDQLERELHATNFLRPADKVPAMVRNLRAMLQRADMTEQEVRTWRGVIS